MKKRRIIMFLFLIIIFAANVSSESYLERVYGTGDWRGTDGSCISNGILRFDFAIDPDRDEVNNQLISCSDADINSDGNTDAYDYILLKRKYNTECSGCSEDLNSDGFVNNADLTIMSSVMNGECTEDSESYNLFWNTKEISNSNYDLSSWNGNVPNGAEFFIDAHDGKGSQPYDATDCSEGCTEDLFDGTFSQKIYNTGFFEHDCGLTGEPFEKALNKVVPICVGDKVVYNYNGTYYSEDASNSRANMVIIEDWSDTPPVDCEREYNLGEYHLFVDFDVKLPRTKTSWGRMRFDFKAFMTVSPNPEKNGKIRIEGKFTMDHISYLILDHIKGDKSAFYNQFVLNSVDKKPKDLMATILSKLLENTGKTTGSIVVSSSSEDKNNKLWNLLFNGNMKQERSFFSGGNSVIKYNKDTLGSFKREEVKVLMGLFDKKINEIITKDITFWNNGNPLSGSTSEYKRYNGIKKVDGEDHYIEIEKFFKDNKLIKIHYLEHLNGDKETKDIVYVLPEKGIEEVLKEAEKNDGKTKSQSVWVSNYPIEGGAVHLSPSYTFEEPIEINFSSGEDFFHFSDSILDGADYDILNSTTVLIGPEGGKISDEYVTQIIPPGAVLKETNFTIKDIFINQISSCKNSIQDNGEEGVDCGGICEDCKETCEDSIKNQDETGIDCGGTCILDVNESCGYDYNNDCSFEECVPEQCSSDLDCFSGLGLCINNICDYNRDLENLPIIINRWKNNEESLENVLQYSNNIVNIGKNIGAI